MKIHDLSILSGINAETIRSYRNRGLLQPHRLENGYYDYSIADYVNLVYIRKLRGLSIPLDDISSLFFSADHNDLLKTIEREQQILLEQIMRLEEERRYLELERIHFMETRNASEINVQVMQSIDDKIDVYDDIPAIISQPASSSVSYYMTTPSLFIPKEILNGKCEDRMIPVRVGVGTYRYVLRENNMTIPENHVLVPNGVHVGQIVSLNSFDSINLLQLKPMMDYAAKNNTPFISDTTGYLMNIERHGDTATYHFRIRACIEKNDIVTHMP